MALKSNAERAIERAAAEHATARARATAARRITSLLRANFLRSKARTLRARVRQEGTASLAAHWLEYTRLLGYLALTRHSWCLAIVLQPMSQLHDEFDRVHGQPSPPDEGTAHVAFQEPEEASKTQWAQMAKAQSEQTANARALIKGLKKAHAAKDKTRHDTRSQLLRKQAATAKHNKSVAIEWEQLQGGRHSHSKRKTLPPTSANLHAAGEVPVVRPDKDGLEALCRIIRGVPLQGYVLVGWRVMLGTKERPVKIDGQPGVFAGCVRSYGPPEAGSDFDHVVDIDLRREDDGTWTLDTGRPYRANLLSRAHFGLWSFCHEQLGHYTSGAPCGLCNVRCVYGSQSCPRCMPADGDELAPGGPLSRVQASDGLRHRRDAAKATPRDAFEELGAPDEFEHSIGAEVVLEIEGERPVMGTVVRQILNWGHFEYPHGLRLSHRVHRWRLLASGAMKLAYAAQLSSAASPSTKLSKSAASWDQMLRSSNRAAHCEWSHSYEVGVETEEGPEVLTVRSSALRTDIVLDSECEADDDDDNNVRTYEAHSDDGESDGSYVDSDLELRADVVVPDNKARLAKKRSDGQSSRSKLNRKHTVTAAAKAPLERISGGKPLKGSVAARRAPEELDRAEEHREIREFLAGTGTGTAAAPTITAAGVLRPTPTAPQPPPPTPDVPDGAPPAVDLLRMHYAVPPKRTPATKTGRDTSVTQQYHFGVTVADQDCSNAAAFELVLDGRRVSAAAVKEMTMAERQRVTRHPVMRLRRNSWVLHPHILGPHIERRLRRLWAFVKKEAETNPALAQRIEYLEAMTQPGHVVLKGLSQDARRHVLVSLGFPETHEAVTDERDSVEFNPRLVVDIPLCQGTVNIAVLAALADEPEGNSGDAAAAGGAAPAAAGAPAAGAAAAAAAARNQLQALLKTHVDEYDLRDGVALLDIAAENLIGGEFEVDLLDEREAEIVLAAGGRVEVRPECYGEPRRYGIGFVPTGFMVAADLRSRPHVVTSARPAAAGDKGGLRHSLIVQGHEPMLSQLRRGDLGEPYVELLALLQMVLDGDLPLSDHEMECAGLSDAPDADAKYANSRWAGVATQEELRTAFETHDVNANLRRLRDARLERKTSQWRALTGTTAPSLVLPGARELCSSLGMPTEALPSLDAALRLGVPERHAGALPDMLRELTKESAPGKCCRGPEPLGGAAESTTEATPEAEVPEERRAARLAAALLAPGAVDSILLSFLSCKEAKRLGPTLRSMWSDISNAYVPCAVPGGELGAQSTTTWLAAAAATPIAERCTAACMRAFFKTAAWEHLVKTPGLLAGLVAGDSSKFEAELKHMEEQRTATGREGPFQCIFKRRYQGCGAGPAVTRALALYDWNSFVKNASTPTWIECETMLMDAAGAGVKEFLAGKMLLGLRLANLAPPMRDDAASLGPGAKVSLYSILHLLREGDYVPSYQLKPKMVGSLGTFDIKRWFTWVSHDLELAMGFYLDARVGGEPELAAVAEFARAHFRNNPSIVVESMLCEVLRRRNVHGRTPCSSPLLIPNTVSLPQPPPLLGTATSRRLHDADLSADGALPPPPSPGRVRVRPQAHSEARQRLVHRGRTRALRSLGRGSRRALGGGSHASGAG